MRRHCCEILEARRLLAASPIFTENFDEYPVSSNWVAKSTNQSVQWQVVASGFGGITAHSGGFMVSSVGAGYQGTSQNPTVPSNTYDVFYSPFDLTGYSNAYVSFWYNIPSLGAGSELRVNANASLNLNDNGAVFTATTATNGWVEGFANLSAFAGGTPTLYFYYSGSGGEGAMLDDITVYTDTPSESIAPTAKLLGNLSNITTVSNQPITFPVEYDDDTAIEPASISSSNIEVLFNGSDQATAQLQNMTVNNDGSIDAIYSFLPGGGSWSANTNGSYTLQVQPSSVFDTSGNAVVSESLGTFSCAIAQSVDSVVFTDSTQLQTSTVGQSGGALPDLYFGVYGIDNGAQNYSAEVYLVTGGAIISASTNNQLLGDIPFSVGEEGSSTTTLDPSSSGLAIPAGLSPGTYAIGVHVDTPSLYPDPNDSNNWAVVGYVTVQPALSNPTVVTVMVLYTAQAENDFGSVSAIQQQINTAIATTNTAFLNSDINVQLQLAYAGEVSYTETDPVTDLTRLSTAGDGYLDQVPVLRSQYNADLVSLWTGSTSTDVIGEAYIAGSAADADLGYNVVVASEANDEYTFSHEIGHNFGAGHAVGDSSGENSDNGLYDYSHGWRFTTSDGAQYHDIMAYPPGTTIPYYSNPNIDYLGVPTGTSGANNALTISEDAANVAGYSEPVVVTVSASAPMNATESSTNGDFRVTATIPSKVEFPVTVTVPLSYTGSPSQSDYQTPASSVSITIPAGQTSSSGDIPITAIDDSVHEDSQTLTMTIAPNASYTVGQAFATMSITDDDPETIVLSSRSVTLSAGGNGSLSVNLSTAIASSETLTISQSNGSGIVLGTTTLTFDPSNYSSPQAVSLSASATGGNTSFLISGVGTSATFNVFAQNPAAPSIASIAAQPASVKRTGSYKITAAGVSLGTGGGKLSVVFYLGTSDVFSTSDKILGTDKSPGGGWTLNGKAKLISAGANTIFAVAKNSGGLSSNPVACVVTVVDQPPVIKKFTAKVIHGTSSDPFVTINASATDSDGKVISLIVWVDGNNDGVPDDGEQTFTGATSVRQTLSVNYDQTYTLSAIAQDNDGTQSPVKRITFLG
ncbi:MAG TPA: M12 family metallo-peptidase [Tepidisphaeraceae bacterium]|jgi:hypothetical protein